jgi:FKBP-type peptidyl-prolyl cis-trans isomerase
MKATWSVFFMALALGLSSCFKNSEDPNAQLNAEMKFIDEYLDLIGETDVLYDNTTGLRFVLDNFEPDMEGYDAPAHAGQDVVVEYQAYTLTSSGRSTSPFAQGIIDDNIDDVLPKGVQYAISVMLEGSSGFVYIPSKHGYGEAGTTTVPPNTTLVYYLQIDEVTRTTAQTAQLDADTSAINTYIKGANLPTAKQHPSGFWYVVNEPPTSSGYPNPYSIITADYTMKLLTASGPGTVIQQSTLTNAGVFGLIDALKLGVPLVGVGSKVTFYIPSTLGYGSTTKEGIPANSNLVFEMKLTSIAQ